jgi:hypothetical protein
MNLTDHVFHPLRLAFYAVIVFFLFNAITWIATIKAGKNAVDCSGTIKTAWSIEYAKRMAVCVRQKNGFLANWRMRPIFRLIAVMPNAPREFVGAWRASRPNCVYRHELAENGRFTSMPIKCNISNERYQGEWSAYEGEMIWLTDGHKMWPPDINAVRWIDKDSFTLVERDGAITKFARLDATRANESPNHLRSP